MTNNPRYTLGTEANRIFMASETYELLKFGKGFPAPNGGSGWLNADGTSWDTYTKKMNELWNEAVANTPSTSTR